MTVINIKQLPAILKSLKRQLSVAVLKGVSEAFNQAVYQYFENHPTGVGVTILSFKPISISGLKSVDVIARFNSPVPAIMELGPNQSKVGYKYPYDRTSGSFLPFDTHPFLKEWAVKNFAGLKPNAKGLYVGKRDTTGYGQPYNKWFTNSVLNLKSQGNTKNTILRHFRSIKI